MSVHGRALSLQCNWALQFVSLFFHLPFWSKTFDGFQRVGNWSFGVVAALIFIKFHFLNVILRDLGRLHSI